MTTPVPKKKRVMTTPAMREAMVRQYVAGDSLRAVAAAAGVVYSTAHRAVSLAGVQRRHQRKRKTTEAN